MASCFKLWAPYSSYDEASISGDDDCFGKEPLLPVPKRKGHVIMQGPQREAPGWDRRQEKSEGKRCAKADIVVSVREEMT